VLFCQEHLLPLKHTARQRDASQLYLEVPTLEGVAVLLWVVLAVSHVFCLCKMLMIQTEKLVYHGFESLLLWKEILTDS